MTTSKPTDIRTYWVPEEMIFNSASNAISAGFGAATLLVDHLVYEQLKAENEKLKEDLDRNKDLLRVQCNRTDDLKWQVKDYEEALKFYILDSENKVIAREVLKKWGGV
jgi:hypothetical protein